MFDAAYMCRTMLFVPTVISLKDYLSLFWLVQLLLSFAGEVRNSRSCREERENITSEEVITFCKSWKKIEEHSTAAFKKILKNSLKLFYWITGYCAYIYRFVGNKIGVHSADICSFSVQSFDNVKHFRNSFVSHSGIPIQWEKYTLTWHNSRD